MMVMINDNDDDNENSFYFTTLEQVVQYIDSYRF